MGVCENIIPMNFPETFWEISSQNITHTYLKYPGKDLDVTTDGDGEEISIRIESRIESSRVEMRWD